MGSERDVVNIVFGGVVVSGIVFLAASSLPLWMPATVAVSVRAQGSAQKVRHPSLAAAPAGALQNGVEWPTGFRPYGPTSIWNTRLTNTTNPQQAAGSAQIIANMTFNGNPPIALNTQEYVPSAPVTDEISHPIVFATARDPLVNTHCYQYCNPFPIPAQIRIPARARAATGADHHLAVIQPNGDEMDMIGIGQNTSNACESTCHDWTRADTIWAAGGGNLGNFYTGSGQITPGGFAATAGGSAEAAGLIRQAELANHNIPHALFIITNCVGPTYVYPAFQNGDNVCNGGATNQILLGMHVWFSMSDAAIDALTTVTIDQKTILHAYHQYGGYIMDSGGNTSLQFTNGLAPLLEAGAQFAAFGVTPPIDVYAAAQGWPTQQVQGLEYLQVDNSGINWGQYFQVLDPCYAQKTC